MSNNAYINDDILSIQSNNKLINDIMNNFWDNDIWNLNIHNINNNYIKDIIQQINNLKKQLTNKNRVFNINQNYDIEIYDKKYIIKEINKLKKDNINYIKIHVECIYDFFIVLKKIVKLKNIHNNIFNNIIYINNQLNDNYNKNQLENEIKNELVNEIENEIENEIKNELESAYNKFIENIDNKEMDTDIINKISMKLHNNIIRYNYFVDEIMYIKKNKKRVIILDTENLLKSFKIQFFIKKHISQEEYDKYFNIWNYGELDEITEISCNISLSEYTNNTKYVEPYSSLSLMFKDKYDLINIFINNYLQDYYVFYTITCKSFDKINNIIINNDNSLCIPIIYEKHDIREQDDHLILFLNYYLDESILISSDKFRWYKDNKIKMGIKNFKFEYDIDSFKINLILDKYHTNDIIKVNLNYYTIPLNNFPIISNFNDICINNINKNSKLKFDDIMNILIIIYSKILENISNNLIITNNIHILNIIINQIIKKISNINKNVEIIFKFLEKNTKKDIFNYLLNGINHIFDDILLLNDSIKHYKNICDIYIILKSIIISYDDINDSINNNSIIKDMTKLYSYIISLYDKINDNIYKIRKLSNNKTDVNILFLELNCIYIYIKKISLCKKNI